MKKWILLGLLLIGQNAYSANYSGLKMQVRTIYPSDIVSIGKAMVYLLEPTSYKLIAYPMANTAPKESGMIVSKPLDPLAKTNDVMTIEKALLQVIGNENALIVDHEHKLISVEPFYNKGLLK